MAGQPGQPGPLYKIGEVERLTGLSSRRIRYYESQGLISAERTAGNQRLYTPTTVQQLKLIKQMIDAGHSLSGIRHALQQQQNRPAPRRPRTFFTPAAGTLTSVYPVRDQGALFDLLWRKGRNQ